MDKLDFYVFSITLEFNQTDNSLSEFTPQLYFKNKNIGTVKNWNNISTLQVFLMKLPQYFVKHTNP